MAFLLSHMQWCQTSGIYILFSVLNHQHDTFNTVFLILISRIYLLAFSARIYHTLIYSKLCFLLIDSLMSVLIIYPRKAHVLQICLVFFVHITFLEHIAFDQLLHTTAYCKVTS